MMKKLLAAAAMAICASSAPAANLITFEEPVVTAMSNSPGLAVPAGAQLSTQYLATLGVTFSSLAGYAAVTNHGFPALTPTPPNILGGTNADGTLNYAAPITASFFDPFNTANKATTNFVKVLGELFGLGSGSVTMTAYDLSGNVLGSVTDTDDKPLGSGPVLQLNLAGIHSVVLSGTSGTVGFDNFEFNDVAAAAVPEPATWLLLIAGFGLVGFSLRPRRASGLAAA